MTRVTEEEFEGYFWGDAWEKIGPEEVIDQSRWVTTWTQTLKNKETGTFIELTWDSGSTESQDLTFEDMDVQAVEVVPVEVKVTQYMPKEE